MKAYQVLLLCIVLFACYQTKYIKYNIYDSSGNNPQIRYQQLQRYKYLRAEQSCSKPTDTSKGISQVFGYFWNGQVCEPCNNPYCECDNTGKCSSCLEGFFLNEQTVNFDQNTVSWQQCFQCRHDYKNVISSSVKREVHQGLLDKPVSTACGITEDYKLNQENLRSNEVRDKYFEYVNSVTFNTKCVSKHSNGNVYQQYGSVCYHITGCQKYTLYARCALCKEGYYLTGAQTCSRCSDGFGSDQTKQTIFFDKSDETYVLTEDSFKNRCKKCHTSDNCDECNKGYYRVTASSYRFNYPAPGSKDNLQFNREFENKWQKRVTAQDTQQWCQLCPYYPCGCTPKDDKDITAFDRTTPYSFFRFMTKEDAPKGFFVTKPGTEEARCALCEENCETCEYYEKAEGENKSKCTKCKTKYILSNNSDVIFQSSTPKSDGTCQQCAPNCYECDKAGTCLPEKCVNGAYYDQKKKTCEACEGENAARCTSSEKITQCKNEEDAESSYIMNTIQSSTQYTQTTMGGFQLYLPNKTVKSKNESPYPTFSSTFPSDKDNYLVLNSETSLKECVKNKNLCRTMENNKGSCKDCTYGYLLYNDQSTGIKRCVQCTNLNGCLDEGKFLDERGQCQCNQCKSSFSLIKEKGNICEFVKNCTKAEPAKDGSTNPQCSQCDEGYRLNADKTQCIRCLDPNCRNCDESRDQCTDCKDGFSLWNTSFDQDLTEKFKKLNQICQTCEYNCKKCANDKVKTCTECKEGYYLLSGVCHNKPANCALIASTTDTTKRCKYCTHGYRLTRDGFCVKCVSFEIGTVHCPVINCTKQSCFYSTFNGTYLSYNKDTTVEEDEYWPQ